MVLLMQDKSMLMILSILLMKI